MTSDYSGRMQTIQLRYKFGSHIGKCTAGLGAYNATILQSDTPWSIKQAHYFQQMSCIAVSEELSEGVN